MSRSEQAQTLSFSKLSACAAIGCVLMLANACRFSTNPGDAIVDTDAGAAGPSRADAGARPPVAAKTSTGTATTPVLDAAVAPSTGSDKAAEVPSADGGTAAAGNTAVATIADGGTAADGDTAVASSADGGTVADGDASVKVDASTSAPRDAGTALQPPSMAAAPPDAGSFASAPPTSDAGAQPAKPAQDRSDMQCSADLANCLLRSPLGYAECLRMNDDNGCPEPDSGVPTTSPVTSEDGKPLSQACQAELANCIMRLPTPENAASCTEKARKCK